MDIQKFQADIAIIGGGTGGVAAALAAARSGCRVILTEESDWIGGQLTSQITPPDEHGWIEQFGCTASYRHFREQARDFYRQHYPLIEAARREPFLNPGNSWVSALSIEPTVAHAVLSAMLSAYVHAEKLLILTQHVPVQVEMDGAERIRSVRLQNTVSGRQCEVSAQMVVDATELGDLLPLCACEYVTGQEARSQTGEPSAPKIARPANQQAFTWCFTLEHLQGADFVTAAPPQYDFWSRYYFPVTPPWPGPLLGFDGLSPRTMLPVRYRFTPNPEAQPLPGDLPPQQQPIDRTLWTYRRIIDRRQFAPGSYASDIVSINWPMNDYLQRSLVSDSESERAQALIEAKNLSHCLLHWLRTEAPREDGGKGWPGLRTCPQVTGTKDGFAKAPYVRESRRIRAVTTILQQDISPDYLPAGSTRARPFEDSVGIGSYRIDLHPSTGGDNFIDVPTLPFQIPLGALIPVRMENLLAGAKNIGTTHITNGCYRLHPIEWNIGEVAGMLAAHSIRSGISPRRIQADARLRERFQSDLRACGVEIEWPETIRPEGGDPHIHAKT